MICVYINIYIYVLTGLNFYRFIYVDNDFFNVAYFNNANILDIVVRLFFRTSCV